MEDSFTGYILQHDNLHYLSTHMHHTAPVDEGRFIIRYGVRYLGKAHRAIVPGLIVLDYGDMLTGEPAWDFLLNKSNLHPRAEVFGYRNDGVDDMIVIKHLDLTEPIMVLVYADDTATTPLYTVQAIIAPEDAQLPHRLQTVLPRIDQLT